MNFILSWTTERTESQEKSVKRQTPDGLDPSSNVFSSTEIGFDVLESNKMEMESVMIISSREKSE